MANSPRRKAALAATIVAGGAVAATAVVARRDPDPPRAALPPLELTAIHRAGTGQPLLLLHGIGAIWHAWSPVLPYLEPHHELIVPTLHGHAGGPPLDSGVEPSVQALVDGIEEQLDRLGLQKVHIAGNSLGGWIGIELARRGRARSLVLLSPAGAWRSPRRIKVTSAGVRFSLSALARYSHRAESIVERRLLRWALLAGQVAHPHHVPRETLVTYVHASGHSPVVDPLLRVLHLSPVDPLPEDRDYPVRLVWGERDLVLPFKHFGSPMLERLPGAELIHLEGVGHVPMSDDPARVAELILEVTRAVDSAPVSTRNE
ncbi:alpha/beta fold hydrolase [Mycobacterium avium]|uniref:alpha/beta fold hydrolase n=1 Tax=Mycobacterium avium TaxID=1764 RepID=UPI000A04037B|nr:alpha/beta hydrolase [Mycobacterium avium]